MVEADGSPISRLSLTMGGVERLADRGEGP